MICILFIIFLFQKRYVVNFMNGVHERLAFFQNVLDTMRGKEVSNLNGYFTTLCFAFCVFEQFPNVILISSLSGLIVFYGNLEATDIFTIIPLISSFQGSILSLT